MTGCSETSTARLLNTIIALVLLLNLKLLIPLLCKIIVVTHFCIFLFSVFWAVDFSGCLSTLIVL